MAIFNKEYITEFFGIGKKKPKVEYHHLNRTEITACINIAKECIKDFPKLKKASHFVNIYREDDWLDNEIPIKLYFNEDGDSKLVIIRGDVWDGYDTPRTNPEEFEDDENAFEKNVNEKIASQNIKANFFNTCEADWDGIEFAITSKKEK